MTDEDADEDSGEDADEDADEDSDVQFAQNSALCMRDVVGA